MSEWKPQSVVLKERLNKGEITHLLDYGRPQMRDREQQADYHEMLKALQKRFGLENVIVSEPLDTLGEMIPDTTRAVVDTERAAAYVVTAALEAELALPEVHAVAPADSNRSDVVIVA